MNNVFYKAVRVLEPVLIHFVVSNLVGMVNTAAGLQADTALLTMITAVLVLPLFVQMIKRDKKARGAEKKISLSVWEYGKIVCLGVASNLALTVALNLMLVHFSFSNQVQERLFASDLPIQIIGLGVIVPIMEEMAFRGLVYDRLKDYNKEWHAALMAAAIFALYHGNIVQILFAFPMALIIIGVYRKWHTLKAPVVFHMAVNLSSIVITVLAA